MSKDTQEYDAIQNDIKRGTRMLLCITIAAICVVIWFIDYERKHHCPTKKQIQNIQLRNYHSPNTYRIGN